MRKSQLLAEYAKDHNKKQIAWFASSLFGVDEKYPANDEGGGNPNHDPETGRFTTGSGGGSSSGSSGKAGLYQEKSNVSSIIEPESNRGHAGRTGRVSKQQNLRNLSKSNRETAKACLEKAKKYPEGSPENKAYKMWAETMSNPLPGRPTPEDSEQMRKKNLKNISSQLQPYAVERYKKDLKNEPKITNDLCDIADELGTQMFGLPYRMKSAGDKKIIDPDTGEEKNVCRIADKIAENQVEARRDGMDDSYQAATDRLSDLVRYTQACTTENLVSNAEATMKALEKKGYKPIKVKNTWETFNEKNPYRGVNCVFESPDGTRFELQFHTAESLVGKEVQHGWYEESRTPGINPRRKAELDKRMYDNMASMKAPKDIGRIKEYPPKTEEKENSGETEKANSGGIPKSVSTALNHSDKIPYTSFKRDVKASEKVNQKIYSKGSVDEKRRALFHEMVNAPEHTAVTIGDDDDTVYIKDMNGQWVEHVGSNYTGDIPRKGHELASKALFDDDMPTMIIFPKG